MKKLFGFKASKKEEEEEEEEVRRGFSKEKIKRNSAGNRSTGSKYYITTTASSSLGKTDEVSGGIVNKDRIRGKSKVGGGAFFVLDDPKNRSSRHSSIIVHPDLAIKPARLGGIIHKQVEAEQIAAGWPAWLANVAGEALRGWIPRRADSFEKLDKVGQGTYSNVYKARDLETGRVVAMKKVRFDTQEIESIRFMAREIKILRRLDHPNVVKLEGLVTSRMSCSLYLVFECMEYDLCGLASAPGIKFSEPQIKCFMQQILRGLDHCHNRGVLHRDMKGSNLLIDTGGVLKIADFGLAMAIDPEIKRPLTNRVVTLWYRPPELLLGATEYGSSIDLWSVGCILAELLIGKPVMPGRTEVEQLHKIYKLCGSPREEYWRKHKLPCADMLRPKHYYKRCVTESFKDYSLSAVSLLETLLAFEPGERVTAAAALHSDYFTTKPLACDPAKLPKLPERPIVEEKKQDDRQGGRAHRSRKEGTRGHTKSQAVPAPEANAELPSSIQKHYRSGSSKSRSERFGLSQEEPAAGFPMEPQRRITQERVQKHMESSEVKMVAKSELHSKRTSHRDPENVIITSSSSRPSSKYMTVADFKSCQGGSSSQSASIDLSSISTLQIVAAPSRNTATSVCKERIVSYTRQNDSTEAPSLQNRPGKNSGRSRERLLLSGSITQPKNQLLRQEIEHKPQMVERCIKSKSQRSYQAWGYGDANAANCYYEDGQSLL